MSSLLERNRKQQVAIHLTAVSILVLVASSSVSTLNTKFAATFFAFAQLSGQADNDNDDDRSGTNVFSNRNEFEGRRLLNGSTINLILYGIIAAILIVSGYTVLKISIVMLNTHRRAPTSVSSQESNRHPRKRE